MTTTEATEPLMPVVELTDISTIKPYPKNAKIHPNDQVENLAKLIKKNGWTQPIVVDRDGVIIIGHGRRLAALHLKLKKVPVIWRRDLTPNEADAMRLSDNRATSTEYDTRAIQEEISRLFDEDFDLSMTGFNDKELEFLTAVTDDIDDSVFIDDVSDAVETQRVENKKEQEKVDATTSPVADAIGFKRVTIAQSRRIRAWMTKVEAETGFRGAEAFFAWLDTQGILR